MRQQPAGQHGLGERHCQSKLAGRGEHLKAVGEARASAAMGLADPGQRQAVLLQRRPQLGLPGVVLGAVDGLRIGEVGKNFSAASATM